MKSVQFFPLVLWYFMFGIEIFIFWEKGIDSGPIFWAKSLQKTCFYVHVKLQRNPSVGSGLQIFIFGPIWLPYNLIQFPPLNSFRTFIYCDLWPYVLWPFDFQIQKRIVSVETIWGNTVFGIFDKRPRWGRILLGLILLGPRQHLWLQVYFEKIPLLFKSRKHVVYLLSRSHD